VTSTAVPGGRAHSAPTQRRGLALFAAVNALAAWGGAVGLVAGGLSLGAELDRRLPLHSSVLAGCALALVVAVPLSTLAGWAWRGDPGTDRMAVATGVLLMGWIAVQLLFLRAFSPFQPLYLAVGVGLVLAGRRRLGRATVENRRG
jgi:hypothetical protein